MQSEFISGFTKVALKHGCSKEEAAMLWKAATENPQVSEIVNNLPVSKEAASLHELEFLTLVKEANEKKDEIENLKNELKSLCV